MRYFSYGTNVNPAVLARKRLSYIERVSATLRDYVLVFNKRSLRASLPPQVGFANIASAKDGQVEGVLYVMEDEQRARLDKLERCPEQYERIEVQLATPAGPVEALTYRARPEVTEDGLLPSRNYINHMLAAGELLPVEYRQELQRRETFAGECAACHQSSEAVFHREGIHLFALCAPCLEARQIWSDTLHREVSVLETEAVIKHLQSSSGYGSVAALLEAATKRGLIKPADRGAAK